jgi:ABC-2 type transport system ATP-binding protein
MTSTSASPAGIVLSGVSKSYGSVQAVCSLNLVIAPGEIVALLGPNGAGKTTTIDMMLGLTRPDSGTVALFGRPPGEAVAAGIVGAMLQTGSLIPHMRVRELVAMVASLYPHPLRVDDVLSLAGIADLADRQASKLSGGQQQRVRLALGLAGDPDLLLLDEPTAAIDVEGRHDFWVSMRSVAAQGKTIVFATHYLEEADSHADRIVLLARGRVVADGPATEIKARVGARTIRATLPGADLARLAALPGVLNADRHGDSVILTCSDAEDALRGLLGAFSGVRDLEVRGSGIEEAFLALTADHDDALPAYQESR